MLGRDVPADELPNGSASSVHPRGIERAKQILDILFVEMTSGHFVTEAFAVQPSDFAAIETRGFDEIVSAIDVQLSQINPAKQHRKEEKRNWDLKVDIVMSIDTILRCFIGQNNQDMPLIRKIWGIVHTISDLSLDEIKVSNHHLAKQGREEVGTQDPTCSSQSPRQRVLYFE